MAEITSIKVLQKPIRIFVEQDKKSPFVDDTLLSGDKALDGSDIFLNDGLPRNDVIYSGEGQRHQIPFAVSMSTEPYHLLEVTVLIHNKDNIGRQFRLSANILKPSVGPVAPSFLFESEPTVLEKETTFKISLPPLVVPIGIRDNIEWTLDSMDSEKRQGIIPDEHLPLGRTPLEFYAIHSPRPAFFEENGGVPLLLLRMFVLPVIAQNIRALQKDWIRLVMNIVHGSQEPITGERKDTGNHWLKFDVWDGHCSFVGDSNGTFALGPWLHAYRAYLAMGGFVLVNCYDQAGATEIALSLGIAHKDIAWEYHQFFGFIKEPTKLVGWGPSNNPYFGSETDNMIISSSNTDRKPFLNHIFLSVGEMLDVFETQPNPDEYDTAGERLVVDSTAGPYQLTRNDYYENKDKVIPEAEATKRYTEIHRWSSGVTGYGEKTPNLLDTFYKQWELVPALTLSQSTVDEVRSQSSSQAVAVPIKALMMSFASGVQNSKAGRSRSQPIVPVVADEIVRFEHKLWHEEFKLKQFKYLRLYLTDSQDTALQAIRDRVGLFTKPVGPEIVVSTHSRSEQDGLEKAGQLRVSIEGDKSLEVFLYENVVIEVGGNFINRKMVENLVQEAWKIVKESPKVSLEEWRQPVAEEYLRFNASLRVAN